MPECSRCRQIKPIEQFHIYQTSQRSRKGGPKVAVTKVSGYCKDCQKVYQRERYARLHGKQVTKREYVMATAPIVLGRIPKKYRPYLSTPDNMKCLYPECDIVCLPSETGIEGTREVVFCCLCMRHWYIVETGSVPSDLLIINDGA